MNHTKSEWYLLSFMLLVVAVVLWQILTVMTEAGIASGGVYSNAAAYPKGLAIILGLLVALRSIGNVIESRKTEAQKNQEFALLALKKPVLLLSLFALYLLGLEKLGYHLMTPVFLIVILYLNGEKKWLQMILFGVLSSFTVAFIFEFLLKIVLPGGVFRINIPW